MARQSNASASKLGDDLRHLCEPFGNNSTICQHYQLLGQIWLDLISALCGGESGTPHKNEFVQKHQFVHDRELSNVSRAHELVWCSLVIEQDGRRRLGIRTCAVISG